MKIKIVNHSPNALPQYATASAAGLDLTAALEESITLQPLERKLIGTGLHVELPTGYEAQIRPRSGWALKHGITVLNSPGTIDADYRGEIKVLLVNLSQQPMSIHPGDRIAQMVIGTYTQINWEPVTSLSDTNRGNGGFGSTGKK